MSNFLHNILIVEMGFPIMLLIILYNELVEKRINKLSTRMPELFIKLNHFVARRAITYAAAIDALTTTIEVGTLADVSVAINKVMTELITIEQYGFSKNDFIVAKDAILQQHKNTFELSKYSTLSTLNKYSLISLTIRCFPIMNLSLTRS